MITTAKAALFFALLCSGASVFFWWRFLHQQTTHACEDTHQTFHACANTGHVTPVRGTVKKPWDIAIVGQPRAEEQQRYAEALADQRAGRYSWYCDDDAPLYFPRRTYYFGDATGHTILVGGQPGSNE